MKDKPYHVNDHTYKMKQLADTDQISLSKHHIYYVSSFKKMYYIHILENTYALIAKEKKKKQ